MNKIIDDFGLPDAAEKGFELFPFQKSGVMLLEEMMKKREIESPEDKAGVLLFDDMGLGKTVEAIALVERMNPKPKSVMVICPNSIKLEWEKAINQWTNGKAIIDMAGRKTLKSVLPIAGFDMPIKTKYPKLAGNPDYWIPENRENFWLIVNYEALRAKDSHILKNFKPDLIIWDEAHRLRNPESRLHEETKNFTAKTEFMLSGTPVVNHPGDLWALLRRIDSQSHYSYEDFMDIFVEYEYGLKGNLIIFGVKNVEFLKNKLSSLGIQRAKEDVLMDLPSKIETEATLSMHPQQQIVYEKMEKELFIMMDYMLEKTGEVMAYNVISQMTRLRQLCCDPRIIGVNARGIKTDYILDYLDSLGNEQIVIFSNFEKYITLLEQEIGDKFSMTRLTGKENTHQRQQNLQSFQKGETQILLGTSQSGGEGINLQNASKIILTDKWWTPARNIQSVNRVHRIGQTNSVNAIFPHCHQTIDDALNIILERKSGMMFELDIKSDVLALLRQWRRSGSAVS